MVRGNMYDVIVAGGGSAGVAAAVGASACGARVLLVEANGFLGGAATQSLVLAWCGFYPQRPAEKPRPVVGGAGRLALDELARMGVDVAPYYSATGNWNIRLNPEATKIALDRMLAACDADLAFHTKVIGAVVSGGRIEAVRLADPRGIREVEAATHVDTTGEASLAFLAGATACGLHEGSRIQPASYPVRISGVAADAPLDKAARAAALSRIERRHGRAELRADGGILTTIPASADHWWLAVAVDTNGLDGDDLAEAERDGREAVWHGVQALRSLPGFANATVAATGPKIGIRETRHAATRGPVREAVLAAGTRPADTVALGGWPMEVHHGADRTEYRPIGADGIYGIGLRAIESDDFGNLWYGGRTAGADPSAYASLRVMGTAFATGHAAGIAAALDTRDASAVRAELLRQGAIL